MSEDLILCKDSLNYLAEQDDHSLPTVVTGIPDFAETCYKTIKEYTDFIEEFCSLIFRKTKKNKYVLFQFMDRKHRGRWISKQYHIIKSAMEKKCPLRFHKIILVREVGKRHLQRPTYQHFLCFSSQQGPGQCTADVIDGIKRDGYCNGHTIRGIEEALDFLDKYDRDKFILDPFCGRGSVLKRAKLRGYKVIGIDIDPKQVQATKTLLL